MDKSSILKDPGAVPVRELARLELTRQLQAVDSGRIRLHIPRVLDPFDSSKGHHFHLYPELFLQVSGVSVMQFPTERFELRPGFMIIAPRGMPHGETAWDRGGPFCNLVFAYERKAVGVHSALSRPGHHPTVANSTDLALDDPREIFRQLDEIVDLGQRGEGQPSPALKGLLLTHLAYLLELVNRPPVSTSAEPPKVAQSRLLVAQHLSNPELNVRRLAGWLGCSPDYLSHCFHAVTGITLTRFINSRRILQAQALLENPAMNVTEVARACGYRDPGYFTRLFRRITGRSPREHRRRMQGAQ